MKPNVILALLAGLVAGFVLGKAVTSVGSSSSSAGAGTETEAFLELKSTDMPAGTFTGMTDSQKYAVMKVMNDNMCDCGCDKGSLAHCVKEDPSCPKSPAKLKQAVELAKQGKNAQQIATEMFGPGRARSAPAAATRAPPPVQQVAVGTAPVKGPASALVTIVEWSDFQCPYCGRVEPTIKQIEEQYKGKVKVAWKNQPMPFHQFAKPAAMAALAANEQGKFWEYHDKLFANQTSLDRPSLERYAHELGLNMDRFKASLDSNKFDAQIQADSQEGQRLGANGTPTFFINGRQIVGAQPFDSFKTIIDEELKKSGR